MRKTTASLRCKTIYRNCACGETAHDAKTDKNSDGEWFQFFKCRNCQGRIYHESTAHLVEASTVDAHTPYQHEAS